MKIKLKIEAFGFKSGSVLDVSPTRAKELIDAGDAEAVDPVSTKKVRPKKISNKSLSAAG
jgi:hypothetical protein